MSMKLNPLKNETTSTDSGEEVSSLPLTDGNAIALCEFRRVRISSTDNPGDGGPRKYFDWESDKGDISEVSFDSEAETARNAIDVLGLKFPDFSREDWSYQVSNGDTSRGYEEWKASEEEMHGFSHEEPIQEGAASVNLRGTVAALKKDYTMPEADELASSLERMTVMFMNRCLDLQEATGNPGVNHTKSADYNHAESLLARVQRAKILAKITPAMAVEAKKIQAEEPNRDWERCLLDAYEEFRVAAAEDRASEPLDPQE